jgi:hypothetical protein
MRASRPLQRDSGWYHRYCPSNSFAAIPSLPSYYPTTVSTFLTGSMTTSLAVDSTAFPSISPSCKYRYCLLREFPATNTFLIPSSCPTTYPSIPTLHIPHSRGLCRPTPFARSSARNSCLTCGGVLLFKKAGSGLLEGYFVLRQRRRNLRLEQIQVSTSCKTSSLFRKDRQWPYAAILRF